MADDEFRENYKNLRQPNCHKLNGATYRKIHSPSKISDVIVYEQARDAPNDKRLAELNKRYGMKKPKVIYSLNKKKRWEVGPKLASQMNEFAEHDLDVRLYESRYKRNPDDTYPVHQSKPDEQATTRATNIHHDSFAYYKKDGESVEYHIEHAPENGVRTRDANRLKISDSRTRFQKSPNKVKADASFYSSHSGLWYMNFGSRPGQPKKAKNPSQLRPRLNVGEHPFSTIPFD